jgi:hypothetical protein
VLSLVEAKVHTKRENYCVFMSNVVVKEAQAFSLSPLTFSLQVLEKKKILCWDFMECIG